MGSLLSKDAYTANNKEEMIFEYTPLNSSANSILEEDKISYMVYPLKDTWVFPWRYKKVKLNIAKSYLPEYHVGFIDSCNYCKFDIPCRIIAPTEDNGFEYILVKPRGILPKKIKTDEPIVKISIIKATQCHMLCIDNQ